MTDAPVGRPAPTEDEFADAAPAGPLRRVLDAHPLATDITVAVLLDVITSLPLIHRGEPSVWVWVLDQALVLPLALRRRYPTAVFAVVAVLASVQWLTGQRLPADVALLFALYTVAAHQPRRRAAAAAGVLEVGVVLASLRFEPTGDGVLGSLVFLTGLVAAAFFLGTSVRSRGAYLASVEDRAVRLERERDQQARLVATAERTRIAREMHDIVAHNLSVMITLADAAAIANRAGPEAATAAMTQVSSTGRGALAEMRRLLGVLREDGQEAATEPQPDLDQLEPLLAQVRSTGLSVRLSVRGAPHDLPQTLQLTVYRVIQEALTNTLKHAHHAASAQVVLDWRGSDLDVFVTDDGSPDATGQRDSGLGLSGMRERLAVHRGTLSAGPAGERGWVVHARLPLPQGAP